MTCHVTLEKEFKKKKNTLKLNSFDMTIKELKVHMHANLKTFFFSNIIVESHEPNNHKTAQKVPRVLYYK